MTEYRIITNFVTTEIEVNSDGEVVGVERWMAWTLGWNIRRVIAWVVDAESRRIVKFAGRKLSPQQNQGSRGTSPPLVGKEWSGSLRHTARR